MARLGVDVDGIMTPAAPSAKPAATLTIDRTIALIGLMGVGKSTVGRRLARRLGLPFADGDTEIEEAAGMTVSDIFSLYGEEEFRAGEARVMKRLVEGPPMVLATGGGAVMNPETRALLKAKALTVWMRADLQVVAERVRRRDTRPLLRGRDPLETLKRMAGVRYPIYAFADVTVEVGTGAHSQAVDAIVGAIADYQSGKTS